MSNGDRPPPSVDPTALTTAALTREIAGVRELIEQRIEGVNEVNDERFKKVEQQFELVERQRVEQKKDTKDAVDAALTAQKEAVREQTIASEKAIAKSETSTNELLKQLSSTFTEAVAGLRREIGEVKDRVNKSEGKSSGIGAVGGAIGVGVGLLIAAVALILRFKN